MKHYLSTAALLAGTMLAVTSCSNEDAPYGGDGGMTVFSVKLPDDLGTRASFGDAPSNQELNVAIYEAGNTEKALFTSINGVTSEGMTVEQFASDGLTATVKVPLVKNKQYDLVFWSQDKTNRYYTYTENGQTLTVGYGEGEGATVQNYNDARDAFFASKTVTSGDATNSQTIQLKRMFAQINVGTNDLQAYTNAGGSDSFGITVSGVATEINLKSGIVSNPTGTVKATTSKAASSSTDFPAITGYTGNKLQYLSMIYVLVGDGAVANKTNVDVSLYANGNAGFATYANVPVQMNYRTNIYGALLTNPEVFNVEIAPAFAGNNNVIDGAVVKMNNGQVVCTTPALPAGVTEAQLEGKGGVAINAQGEPVFFEATGAAVNAAMKQSSEIYFAPNVTITTESHKMGVPQSGITIHGNGATISGGEQDFSIQEGTGYNTPYQEGSTINININNLNGVKVWGGPTTNATFNINLNNCTMKGLNNMVMVRSQDNATCKVNLNAENCYLEGMQVAFHTTLAGTEVYKNCTFKNVGVPINIAKKLNGALMSISVIGCTFDNCGIAHDDTANSAYNYAAPIRVVDNGGPENAINLLVDGCTFTGTLSQWDLLLMDYREGTPWRPVNYTIRNCTPANPKVRDR